MRCPQADVMAFPGPFESAHFYVVHQCETTFGITHPMLYSARVNPKGPLAYRDDYLRRHGVPEVEEIPWFSPVVRDVERRRLLYVRMMRYRPSGPPPERPSDAVFSSGDGLERAEQVRRAHDQMVACGWDGNRFQSLLNDWKSQALITCMTQLEAEPSPWGFLNGMSPTEPDWHVRYAPEVREALDG